MSILNRTLVFFLVAMTSGCAVTSSYVSSIGMRARYSEIEAPDGSGKVLSIYESKMQPAGGPCLAFTPYKSLRRSEKRSLVERRDYEPGDFPLDKEYRKWYGYPAQSLQLLAIPVDIGLTAVAGAGALVLLPFWGTKMAFSSKDKSDDTAH